MAVLLSHVKVVRPSVSCDAARAEFEETSADSNSAAATGAIKSVRPFIDSSPGPHSIMLVLALLVALPLPAPDALRNFAIAAGVIGLQVDHGLRAKRLEERISLELIGGQDVVYHP